MRQHPHLRRLKLGVMGYSLGGAMAVDFSSKHTVDRVVLFSPFTSMQDMLKTHYPWTYPLLRPFLFDQYDIESGLDQLLKQRCRPKVFLLHGSDDEVVPVTMSRSMAERFSAGITYQEIPLATHDLVSTHADIVRREVAKLCEH
nr:dienelactone hydrolase family protein [Candidatus Synchoanobacter obligatus]